MMYKKKGEKDSLKWRLLPLILLSLCFYGGMLILTFTAKDIHNARLPKVTASRLATQKFEHSFKTEEGMMRIVTRSSMGIPKDIVDSGQVFSIYSEEKNGMRYTYAVRIPVEVSVENEEYYAVDSGITSQDMIILSGYEELEDGCEVYVVKKKKK